MTDTPQTEKKLFERKHLDTKDDIVNTRFNDDERAMLERTKAVVRCDADGTVLKKALEFLHNALLGRSQEAFYLWLSEARRVRPGPR